MCILRGSPARLLDGNNFPLQTIIHCDGLPCKSQQRQEAPDTHGRVYIRMNMFVCVCVLVCPYIHTYIYICTHLSTVGSRWTREDHRQCTLNSAGAQTDATVSVYVTLDETVTAAATVAAALRLQCVCFSSLVILPSWHARTRHPTPDSLRSPDVAHLNL